MLRLQLVGLALALASAASPRYDIVHIVMDDGGYNDLEILQNRSRGLVHPTISQLAAEGIVFSDFHAQPICTPTRSALMTGSYPVRLGTHANVIYWNTPWAVPSSEYHPFIPQRLKETAGYGRCAMFGKSHLGEAFNAAFPSARGFDEFDGFLQGCQSSYLHISGRCTVPIPNASHPMTASNWSAYEGYDWWTSRAGATPQLNVTVNGTFSSYIVRDNAVRFLQSVAQGRREGDAESLKPFYLYLPFKMVHAPLQVPEQFRKLYPHLANDPEMQVLQGMISMFDAAVGSVMQELRSSGLDAKAVVLLHSDNGAPTLADRVLNGSYTATRNVPLRGWKTQIFEGGTRVPALLWGGPGILKERAGTVYDGLAHVTDVMPTLVEGVGGGEAGAGSQDGVNLWASLTDPDTPSPRKEMLYNLNPLCESGQAGKPKAGYRVGEMKLLCECWDQQSMSCTGQKLLFNLSADLRETTDLSGQMPAVVQQLEARLRDVASDMVYPMQWTAPFQGPDYFCADCPLGNQSEPYHAWRPWLPDPVHWPRGPKMPVGHAAE